MTGILRNETRGARHYLPSLAIAASLAGSSIGIARAADDDPASRHVYSTGGVHNDKDCVPASKCLYARQKGEPSNPLYPVWWSSDWVMYRVFKNYDTFPPP